MKTTLQLLFLLYTGIMFSVLSYAQTGCSGKSVLFVGTDPGGLGDSTVREHLEQDLGFTTEYAGPGELDAGDVLTYDVIIISSTISSTDANMFQDVEVPIICMESFALDNELLMVQDPTEAGFSTMANIPYIGDKENSFDSLHVNTGDSVVSIGLDAGYAGQNIEVFSGDVPFGNNRHPGQWGVPNENAYLILEYKQSTLDMLVTEDLTLCGENGGDFCANPRYAAFAYPKGVEMAYDGSISPEKRSFFFFHDYSASVATSKAWDIFNALVYWSMECLDRPDPNGVNILTRDFNINVYPNPTSDAVNLTFKIENEDIFKIEVIDLMGKIIFHKVTDAIGKYTCSIPLHISGFYMLKVTNQKSQQTRILKIMRE